MKLRSPLQVLVKMRRLELDTSRRDLVELAWRQEDLNGRLAGAWRDLPDIADQDTIGVRGQMIVATRNYTSLLQMNLAALDSQRRDLEDRVREKLLYCRQLEIAMEQQTAMQTKNALKKQEVEQCSLVTARFTPK
jgi:hypothetical protein